MRAVLEYFLDKTIGIIDFCISYFLMKGKNLHLKWPSFSQMWTEELANLLCKNCVVSLLIFKGTFSTQYNKIKTTITYLFLAMNSEYDHFKKTNKMNEGQPQTE